MQKEYSQRLKKFGIFSSLCFGPFIIILLLSSVLFTDGKFTLLYYLFLSAAVLLMYICFGMVRITPSIRQKGIILYIFWGILLLPLLIVFSMMLGGVSMAVNDGGASVYDFLDKILLTAVEFFLLGSAFIIPWIILSLFIFRKFLPQYIGYEIKKTDDQKSQ